ncbi:MAG: NTP transferase domain-containing protein [Microthrixaceae bacterium]|nr:NTP transferase domain-containing protein [Microthrixaceae bacterium]MCO5312867.1 NTP transferase domain-containing protein [Microthrixaceae bacterium]
MALDGWIGAVLVGGDPSSDGTERALVDVDGVPIGSIALDALHGAGIERVMLVGATDAHTAALDGEPVDDVWPGEGSAGAILTALHHGFLSGASTVVVLACDLPAVSSAAVARLIDTARSTSGSTEPQVVMVKEDGTARFPNGVYAMRLLPTLEARFADGALSVSDLIAEVPVLWVDGQGAFRQHGGPG